MAGDLLVFPRRENIDPATGSRIASGAACERIVRSTEMDAGPGQATADRGADFHIIFPDAAGKY